MNDPTTTYGRIVREWMNWRPFWALVALAATEIALGVIQAGWWTPDIINLSQLFQIGVGLVSSVTIVVAPVLIASRLKEQLTDRSAQMTPAERRRRLMVAAEISAGVVLAQLCLVGRAFLFVHARLLTPHQDPRTSMAAELPYLMNYLGLALLAASLAAWTTLVLSPWSGVAVAMVMPLGRPFVVRGEAGLSMVFWYSQVGRLLPRWQWISQQGWGTALTWFGLAGLFLAGLWIWLARVGPGKQAAHASRPRPYAQAWGAWKESRWFLAACVLMGFEAWVWMTGYASRGRYGDMWGAEPTALLLSLLPMLLTVTVPVMLVWRVMLHLGDWRSALIPGHRRGHLVVFTAIAATLLIVMVFLPAAVDWAPMKLEATSFQARFPHAVQVGDEIYNYPPADRLTESAVPKELFTGQVDGALGDLALSVLVIAVLGWVAMWGWLALGVIGMALAASAPVLIFYSRSTWLGQMEYQLATSALLVPLWIGLDVCLLAGLWLRLACMKARQQEGRMDDRAAWLSLFLVGFKRQPAGAMKGARLWRRASHRRAMGLGRRFCVILAVYLAGLVAVSPLLADSDWLDHLGYSFGCLVVAAITSSLAVGLAWPERFAALSDVELLRPAGRRRFAQEVGLAMLFDMAEISVLTLAAVLVPIAFWSPAAVHSGVFWSAALAAVLSQAMAFGVIAWTASRRWDAGSVSAVMFAVVIGATVVLIHQALDDRRIMPAVAAAVIGVGLTVHAYHGWAKVDML